MAMIVCTALCLREEHFSVLRRYPSDADALGFLQDRDRERQLSNNCLPPLS